jgi:hypothetical protein
VAVFYFTPEWTRFGAGDSDGQPYGFNASEYGVAIWKQLCFASNVLAVVLAEQFLQKAVRIACTVKRATNGNTTLQGLRLVARSVLYQQHTKRYLPSRDLALSSAQTGDANDAESRASKQPQGCTLGTSLVLLRATSMDLLMMLLTQTRT